VNVAFGEEDAHCMATGSANYAGGGSMFLYSSSTVWFTNSTIAHCVAAEPYATFLRVGVSTGRHEVAYGTAVLGRLRGGYRILQMRGPLGTRIELCYLFVQVSFGTERHLWATSRQQARQLRELLEYRVASSAAKPLGGPFGEEELKKLDGAWMLMLTDM
jgi:hypothetical protein